MDLEDIEVIFFDLDETLLLLDFDKFWSQFIGLFNQYFKVELQEFAGAFQQTFADINQGERPEKTFYHDFCDRFADKLKLETDEVARSSLEFYNTDFDKMKPLVTGSDLSAKLIEKAKKKYRIFLATNPVTHSIGTHKRMRWIGLIPDDFEFISAADNFNLLKPDPAYYEKFLEIAGVSADKVLMVGNDLETDAAASQVGIRTWIINDYPELMNEKARGKYKVDYFGSLQELYEKL